MRFYTTQYPLYCGIDLHARSMYVGIMSHAGEVLLHRNLKAAPEPLLKATAPYREGLVVAVRCKPCPVSGRFSVSYSSTNFTTLTAFRRCKILSPTVVLSRVPKNRLAHAWARPAKRLGTLTSSGPCPKRQRCSGATIRQGNALWPAERPNMGRGKPYLAWRTSWRGPSMTGSSATRPLIWTRSSMAREAARVSLRPYWTRWG
jgi:hypothetical protein